MPAHAPPFTRCARIALGAAVGVLLMSGCASQKQEGYYDPAATGSISDSQYQGEGAAYRNSVRAPSQLQIELRPRQPARTPGTAVVQNSDSAAPPTESALAPETMPVTSNDSATTANKPSSRLTAASQADTLFTRGTAAAATAAAVATPLEENAESTPFTPSPLAQRLIPQAQTYLGTVPCFGSGMTCTGQRMMITLAPNGRWRARTTYLDGPTPNKTATATQGCWSALDEKPARIMLMDAQNNVRAEFVAPGNNVLTVRAIDGARPNLSYNLTRQPDLDPIDELNGQAAPACL